MQWDHITSAMHSTVSPWQLYTYQLLFRLMYWHFLYCIIGQLY
jgi:hypothetical protein